MAGLLDFLRDEQAQRDMAANARNLLQATSNGVAAQVTAPVDLMAWTLRKLGYPIPPAPVGGTDWAKGVGLLGDVTPGASQVAGDVLGAVGPSILAAKAPQIAGGLLQMGENAAAPSLLNKQAGMIKTPFGRIPETLDERIALRKMLERNAEASGYEITDSAATSGASLYSEIMNPKTGASAVVRLSDHQPAMKYVPSNTPYFSVSPDQGAMTSGGTFEQAVSWLGRQGLPIKNIGPRYESFLTSAQKQLDDAAAASAKARADAAFASQQKLQNSFDSGAKYVLDSTKLNSGGRRYDIKMPGGKSYTAYSKNIPEEIRTGDRDALVEYIVKTFGGG